MIFSDVIGGFTAAGSVPLPINDQAAPEVAPATVTVTAPAMEAPKPEPKPKPARKKATPKPTTPPQPQPAPALDGPPLPGEDGFEDIGAPPIEDEQPAEPLRTEAQSKKLFACLRSLGIADRDRALEMIGSILGQPIESTKDLTKAHAAKVIDALESMEEPIEAEVVDE